MKCKNNCIKYKENIVEGDKKDNPSPFSEDLGIYFKYKDIKLYLCCDVEDNDVDDTFVEICLKEDLQKDYSKEIKETENRLQEIKDKQELSNKLLEDLIK